MLNTKYSILNTKKVKPLTWLALGLLVMLAPIVYFTLINPRSADAAWYSGTWTKRKKLTIDNTKVSGSTDLTNFPILVSLVDANVKNFAQSDGDDILFTSQDGTTKLDHEIEKYTASTGTLLAWVRIPTLYTATDTVIYMYYGNSSASSQQNGTGVWDSNYEGVWHFSETSGQHQDSTSNNYDSSSVSVVTQGSATGKVDGADEYNNSGNNVQVTNATNLQLTAEWTAEAWVNPDTIPPSGYDSIIYDTSDDPNYFIELLDSNELEVGFGYAPNTYHLAASTTSPISTGTFNYVAATFNNSTNTILGYVNTTQVASNTSATNDPDTSDNLEFGSNTWSEHFDGVIDEIRISSIVRSTDWMTTTYNTINSPQTFFTSGNQEEQPNTSTVEGPIVYWNMDEGYGSTVGDSSGNSNTGTIANAAWRAEEFCVVGKCLFFDGTGDTVSRTADADFDFLSADSFSIMGWFRHGPVASGTDVILARHHTTGSDGGFKLLMENDGDITCGIDRDSTFTPEDSVTSTAATYDDNQWHHVACVKNGTTSLTLYVDGVSVGTPDSSIASTGTYANADTMYLGMDGDGSSNGWIGFLDEFKIYRSAKTATDINSEVIRGAGRRGAAEVFGVTDTNFLSEGLVGYWPMDEVSWNGTSNEVVDSSGNGGHGTRQADATTTGGKFGPAGTFDGTGDYVIATETSGARSETFTVSAWVYPTDTNANTVIARSTGGNSVNYRLFLSNRNPSLQVGDGSTNTSVAAGVQISLNTWTHIAASIDENLVVRMYINGSLLNTQTVTITPSTSILNLHLAANSGGTLFIGRIDEARIYNRALSSAEVQALYNWAPGPIIYYPFEEGSGTTAYNRGSVLYDDDLGDPVQLTLDGDAKFGTGKFGGALENPSEDPSDDGATGTGEINALRFRDGQDFTLSAWIYLTNHNVFDNAATIVSKGNCCGAAEYILRIDNDSDNLNFGIIDDAASGNSTYDVTSTNEIPRNTWTHVAGVFDDDSDVNIYINGVLDSTASKVGTLANIGSFIDDAGFNIGTTFYDFGGRIDEVKVYNYARTAQQIVEDMNAGHPAGGSPIGSHVAHWKLDETQGTTAQDDSPNNNDLTLSAASWTLSGKYNSAWVGTGSTILSRADDSDFDFAATDSFSISLWFKHDTASSTNYIVAKHGTLGSDGGYKILMDSDGDAACAIDDDDSFNLEALAGTAQANYDDNTWHHLVCTKDGTSALTLYIDGKEVNQDDTISAIGSLANSDTLYIGVDGDGTSNEWVGELDEIKFFRSALTAEQVKIVYNANAGLNFGVGYEEADDLTGGAGNPPVAWWPMDEASWTVNCSTDSAFDKSGNNLHLDSCLSSTGPRGGAKGKYGNAGDFDGVDDYLFVPVSSTIAVDNALDELTVEAWIFPRSDGEGDLGRIIDRTSGSVGYLFYVESESAGLVALDAAVDHATTDARFRTNSIVPINQWSHVAFTYNEDADARVKIYVNSTLITAFVTNNAGVGTLGNDAAQSGKIGSRTVAADPDRTFDGRIDDFKIYNYARTATQIAYDFNRGGPYAWYKFDECSGGTLNNSGSGGSTHDGTLSGTSGSNTGNGACTTVDTATKWYNGRNGKFNSSLDFDGSDDIVSVSDHANLDLADGYDASWSVWFNRNSFTTDDMIFSKPDTGSAAAYYIVIDDATDEVQFGVGDTGNDTYEIHSDETFTASGWHHVVIVWDDDSESNTKMYIDGKEAPVNYPGINDPFANIGDMSNARALEFGIFLSGVADLGPFDGQIDDFRFFRYVLSASQVQKLYNDGAARFGPESGSP